MPSLYAMLDSEARAWWYFRELRQHGQAQEARVKERESIWNTVRMLRDTLANGGVLYCGRGGFTLHYSGHGRLEGYTPDHMREVCERVGIPVIDTRELPPETVFKTLRIPMVAVAPRKPDAEPYTSISYAPREYVLREYSNAGAYVSGYTGGA